MIPYENFEVIHTQTRANIINPPQYAEILNVTYKHTNKNGTPDKRYKTNPKTYEVSAFVIQLKSNKDISIPLVMFNKQQSEKLYNIIESLIKRAR